jgi:hypothetical protein
MAVQLFNPSFYRAANPDLAGLSDEQLRNHFFSIGIDQGRQFSPFVDLELYRASNPTLIQAGINTNRELFDHLQTAGVANGRRFSKVYDPNYYLAENPDLAPLSDNLEVLFNHFRDFGIDEGRAASGVFDPVFYLSNNLDLLRQGFSTRQALDHYQLEGINQGRVASESLDPNFYLLSNPDLKKANFSFEQAVQHFIVTGQNEGRIASPPRIPEDPGNSIPTALDADVLVAPRTFNQSVGTFDSDDYYRFSIPRTGLFNLEDNQFNLTLDGLTGDADVQLIADFNNNGLANQNEIIATSQQGANNIETLSATIAGGQDYIVRVFSVSGDTNYRLTFAPTQIQRVPTLLGTTIAQDQDLGIVSVPERVNDFVGDEDPQDFYQFTLPTASRVGLVLDNLTADADLQLIQDANNNGTVDTGEILGSSTAGGISQELLTRELPQGTYLMNVSQFRGNSNYNLTLFTEPLTFTPDTAGNSLPAARNAGQLVTTINFSEFVGDLDPNDFYRFELAKPANVRVSLAELSADADLRLIQDINGNGAVEQTEILRESLNVGAVGEGVDANLETGAYFVQVAQGSGNTNYNLTINLTGSVSQPPTADPGNDLSTAFETGLLVTPKSFSDFVGDADPVDFYSFRINKDSQINIELSNLNADADLRLIQDLNENGTLESGEIIGESAGVATLTETISTSLETGTYFIQVRRFENANTPYDLNFNIAGVGETGGDAGNTISDAELLGTLGPATDAPIVVQESIGTNDNADVFGFDVDASTNITATIDEISGGDPDLQLIQDLNENGQLDGGEEILAESVNASTVPDSISRTLEAGTYFIRVFPGVFGEEIDYTLTLSSGE